MQTSEKKVNPGQIREIYCWDEKRENLIVKDTEDLDEVMKERAKGVGIYDMLERYGDLELIPGYGADTIKSDGKLHHGADQDFSDVPEFGTDILNKQMELAEQQLADAQKKAEEAAKAAEEAKKFAEEAERKKQAWIAEQMAKKKEGE